MVFIKAVVLLATALSVSAQDSYGSPSQGAFGARGGQGSFASGSNDDFAFSVPQSSVGSNNGFSSGSSGFSSSGRNSGGFSSGGSSSGFSSGGSSSGFSSGSSNGGFSSGSSGFSSGSGNGGFSSGSSSFNNGGSSSFRGSSSGGFSSGSSNGGFSSGSSSFNGGSSSFNGGSSSFNGGSSSFNGGSSSFNGGRSGSGVVGSIDFSQGTRREDGRLCVTKESTVETLARDPILECTHKQVEKCHYTYKTQFKAAQEEVCEENFEKLCQITFKQQATRETVKKCYRPLQKVCNGQGPTECRTVYESSCSTRYIEKRPGKFVGDTQCEKLPVEICGAGCVTEEGPEECHDKEIDSLVDVPEEVCDLNPQKTCRLQTKLVPSLVPTPECTVVPQETCQLRFSNPRKESKPLRSDWCQDDSPVERDETYNDFNARGDVIGSGNFDNGNSFGGIGVRSGFN